ncbi:hypothetical protein [Paenisporosarcina sp. NPDC076898]|uniref:hypothetical protein n=1 Tax=unclassified Paenisporosarcina TaxID=2642018 RepID=UPI003D078892
MGRAKGVRMKIGRTRKYGDPNDIQSFSIDFTPPKSVFRKPRKRPRVSDTEEAIVGWLGGIFILLPILLFLIYLLPEFFGVVFLVVFGIWLLNWLAKKLD